MSVRILTDSTADLSPDVLVRSGVAMVPLHLIVDDMQYREGIDLTPEILANALKRTSGVGTSMPSPRALLEAYERLAEQGATEIVSIHLSAELSGTHDAALLAARHAPVPVRVVDSTTMGMALGYAVLSAARAADEGASGEDVELVAIRRAASCTVLFYVNSLEHLRRGGRIGAASAFLGTTFSIKPILSLAEGHIVPVEKVRTSAKALARLQDLVVSAVEGAVDAGQEPVDVAVQFLDTRERAARLADALAVRFADRLTDGRPMIVELGAIAAAHLGPGTLAVVVAPALSHA